MLKGIHATHPDGTGKAPTDNIRDDTIQEHAERGFAGPIGSDNRHVFTRVDVKRQVRQRLGCTWIGVCEILDSNNWLSHATGLPARSYMVPPDMGRMKETITENP